MIETKCQNCCKQFLCKIKDIREESNTTECKDFKSWIYTKNYGEVTKQK